MGVELPKRFSDPSPSSFGGALPVEAILLAVALAHHLSLGNIPFDRYYCYILRFQLKVDTKTERDAIGPSIVPASRRIRKSGMSDYGCDGLEGCQPAVESAKICGKMVSRPLRSYAYHS